MGSVSPCPLGRYFHARADTNAIADIDWEYPGGNGADYKQTPNSAKTGEISAFPKLLKAVRAAIGDKIISIAVPGKKIDMIAYTAENGPAIWDSVDMINVSVPLSDLCYDAIIDSAMS